MTILRVCSWCDREIDPDGRSGQKVANHCDNPAVSHGCCNDCRGGVEDEIAAFKKKVAERKEGVLLR